ncbi:MAG: beta-lactamase family protein [Planctomycetaceae bacterium]|nr:beta-lactamase family protein [Planctomycetaceae bacterium]
MLRRHPHLLAGLLLLLLNTAAAGGDYRFDDLDAFVTAELQRNDCPGAVVTVVLGKEVLYTKAYGLANIETGEPMQADMLFLLASTTKMFTAAAVAALVEAGKLKFDAPLGECVSGLPPALGRLTLHQALTHTAGLAATGYGNVGPQEDSRLGEMLRTQGARFCLWEPGAIYSYSNVGYWLAGVAIESASGSYYAPAVSELILKPLGMTRATFYLAEAKAGPMAHGHGPAGQGPARLIPNLDDLDIAATRPAGKLFCSAPLFARFCIAFMNDGELEGKRALSPYVIQTLSTPYVTVPAGGRRYGYGLNVEDRDGVRWLSHGGILSGYGSTVRMCPSQRFAVIVLANKTAAQLTRVQDKAAEVVLGIRPSPGAVVDQVQPIGAEEMRRYAGSYVNKGTIELLVRDGRLVGKEGGLVTKVRVNRFRRAASGDAPQIDFSFVTNSRGEVEYLVQGIYAFKRKTCDSH